MTRADSIVRLLTRRPEAIPYTPLFRQMPGGFGSRGGFYYVGDARFGGSIQRAIDAASSGSGGTVLVPEGRFSLARLLMPAGVSIWGAGVDITIIDLTGAGPVVEGTESWYHQTFQDLTLSIENNTNSNVDIIDAQHGANTCTFKNLKLITTGTYGRHGLVIRGVDPGSSTANNAQYNNLIENVRTLTAAGGDASGVGLYLYGQDVTNARANSNQVIGGVLDGFDTGCFIHGNGNHVLGTTFNGPAATAALHIYGDNGSIDNTVTAYFDPGITGDKIRLELTLDAVAHMVTVVGGRGIKTPSDIALAGSYQDKIYYTLFSRGIWPGSVNADQLTSVDSQVYAGADDAGVTQYLGGRDWASGKVLASGVDYAGGVGAVSDAGGLSLSINDDADAQVRIVRTADGSSYTVIFRMDRDGNVIGQFPIESESLNDLLQATVYSDSYVPTFKLRRAKGSKASPAAITSGAQICRWFVAGAYNTTPAFGTGAKITAYATENWSASGFGSKWVVAVVPAGSTSLTDVLTIDENGLAMNSGYLRAPVYTDATRGSPGTAGRVIFNSDDGQLNIDDGTNWTLPNGTAT